MKEVSRSILFTDIVNFTKLRASLGDANAFKILMQVDAISAKVINKYEGKVIKTIGDSIMAVFDSPINCIKSAIEMQQEYFIYNKRMIDNKKKLPPIRMGLCYGLMDELDRFDTIDYLGTIVDRASRLESLAAGNHILTTETDIQLIEGRIASLKGLILDFHNHGKRTLKGLGDFTIIELLYRVHGNPLFISSQTLEIRTDNLQEQILKFINSRHISGVDALKLTQYTKEYQKQHFLQNFGSFLEVFTKIERESERANEAIMSLTELGVKNFPNPDQIAYILSIYADALLRAGQIYETEDVLQKALEIHSETASRQIIEDKIKKFEFVRNSGSLRRTN